MSIPVILTTRYFGVDVDFVFNDIANESLILEIIKEEENGLSGAKICRYQLISDMDFVSILNGTSNNIFHESINYEYCNFVILCFDVHFAEYVVKSQFDSQGYASSIFVVFNKMTYSDSQNRLLEMP